MILDRWPLRAAYAVRKPRAAAPVRQQNLNGACSQMKTATLSSSIPARAMVLAALVAGTCVALGLGLATYAHAQDDSTRTVATGSGIPLAQDAPDRYTVKHGDTLWD